MGPLKNMSSVIFGMVATLAPAAQAFFFAWVCVSEVPVAAMTTSECSMAAAAGPKGSSPFFESSGIRMASAFAPIMPAASNRLSPIRSVVWS